VTDRSTWKKREQAVARLFFSERTPLSGGNSKHTRSDSLSPVWYVEAKFRARSPVVRLHRDTMQKAAKEDKIPVTVLCEKHRPGMFIVVSASDFKRAAAMYLRQCAYAKFKRGKDGRE